MKRKKGMYRPYSLSELKDIEKELHSKYRLSNVFAEHLSCKHRYRVKKGGRKEQHIVDIKGSPLDEQTCSLCFKIRTSVDVPSSQVIDNVQSNDGNTLDRQLLWDKEEFYKWLFQHDYN